MKGPLRGIPWAVADAVATRRYMPERATQGLDIVVLERDGQAVRRRLLDAGFSPVGELSIGGSSWRTPSEVAVDVIEGQGEWWPLRPG
ncbi:MAG: hypothetical protein GEU28_15020 [Dehalococcoidia bacterium]|nr:hypothetical protein [Dehalococcoidia bacterium]